MEETRESEAEKRSWERWKDKNAITAKNHGANGNGGLAVERVKTENRVLKRRKMTVEGIDCQMRNPRKRLWTTASGGEAGGIDLGLSGFLVWLSNPKGFLVWLQRERC